MSERYHTVIVVPHSRAKLRKWRISTTRLRLMAGSLLLATVGATLTTFYYLRSTVDRHEIDRLRGENETLRQVNQSFEGSIRRLQTQLNSYEDRTRQLAIVAGLETLSGASEAGIGGDSADGFDSVHSLVESMEIRSERIGGQLTEIEGKLQERLAWIAATPAVAPVRGILTSGFGHRLDPVTGKRAFHPALDIAAPAGHPVTAPADGLVLRAGRDGGLGKAVSLSHGFGISTQYGHLARVEVRPGQRVRRGEVLGYVGNSGRATGYHLHYEVHVDGKPVDPLSYILDYPSGR